MRALGNIFLDSSLKNLLIEVRVDLNVLKNSVTSKEIKERFKWEINGIDIVGCELPQNIAKKLKEK